MNAGSAEIWCRLDALHAREAELLRELGDAYTAEGKHSDARDVRRLAELIEMELSATQAPAEDLFTTGYDTGFCAALGVAEPSA